MGTPNLYPSAREFWTPRKGGKKGLGDESRPPRRDTRRHPIASSSAPAATSFQRIFLHGALRTAQTVRWTVAPCKEVPHRGMSELTEKIIFDWLSVTPKSADNIIRFKRYGYMENKNVHRGMSGCCNADNFATLQRRRKSLRLFASRRMANEARAGRFTLVR